MSSVLWLVRDPHRPQGERGTRLRRGLTLTRQNSRYVVEEGAKQKNEDWDPEENGGFAVHGEQPRTEFLESWSEPVADTEAPSASEPPADPFDHLEKTINQQTWAKQKASHLTDLLDASNRLSADPYMVSSALRRRFREEKKVILEKQGRDDGLREKYGLHEEVDLGDEDVEKSRAMWEARREARGLPVGDGDGVDQESASGWEDSGPSVAGSSTAGTPRTMPGSLRKGKGRETDGSPSLAQVLRKSTAKRYDPFADAADALLAGSSPQAFTPSRLKLKTKDPSTVGSAPTPTITKATVEPAAPATSGSPSSFKVGEPMRSAGNTKQPTAGIATLPGGLLAGYGSD